MGTIPETFSYQGKMYTRGEELSYTKATWTERFNNNGVYSYVCEPDCTGMVTYSHENAPQRW